MEVVLQQNKYFFFFGFAFEPCISLIYAWKPTNAPIIQFG
jgi:hypothetical protein